MISGGGFAGWVVSGCPESTCPVSRILLSFGRVGFEGRGGQVGVEGPLPVECFVGPDAVVFVGEGGDVFGEVDSVGDVLSVEALVFDGFEPALDDAVGVRAAVSGAYVAKCALVANQRATAVDFMAGPLSVTTAIGAISPVRASTQHSTSGRPSRACAADALAAGQRMERSAPW